MANPILRTDYNILEIGEKGSEKFGTFSPTDMFVSIILPNSINSSIKLGSLSMMSISTHRDKFPVTCMGQKAIKGFTAGHSIIGGTLMFNSFDRGAFYGVMEHISVGKAHKGPFLSLADELPLFNIDIVFINEFGNVSVASVNGVTIIDSGTTYTIEDIDIKETYSYMAKSIIPLQPFTASTTNKPQGIMGDFNARGYA